VEHCFVLRETTRVNRYGLLKHWFASLFSPNACITTGTVLLLYGLIDAMFIAQMHQYMYQLVFDMQRLALNSYSELKLSDIHHLHRRSCLVTGEMERESSLSVT